MARSGIDAPRGIEAMRERLAELDRMVAAVRSEYTLTGDPEHAVRCKDVAAVIAERLGMATFAPTVRRDLKACLEKEGWAYRRLHNRRLWMGVRPVGLSDEAAREVWREDHARILRSSGNQRRAVLRRKGLL